MRSPILVGMGRHESWSPWFPFGGNDIGCHAPSDKGGVYCIADSGEKPVYVGMAESLHARLAAHQRGSSDQSECIRDEGGMQFRFVVIENPAERERFEAMLREMDPPPLQPSLKLWTKFTRRLVAYQL